MINCSLPNSARGCAPQPPTGRSLSGGEFNFETMSKSRTLSLGPEAERQLERVAVHEAGHETVAEAFGLEADCFVAGRADGVCTHRLGTPHQNAGISWGGTVAEDLLSVRSERRTLPTVHLSATSLSQWFSEMMTPEGKAQLSSADLEGIMGYPLESSCRAAFDILSERTAVLRIEAKLLAADSREQVFQSISRGGSGEADRIDVELFVRQARQAAIEAQQRANTEELAAKMDGLVSLPRFPAEIGVFLSFIVASGQGAYHEHAQRLLDFAEHRRARHGEPDFLSTRFETAEHCLCCVHSYRDWLEHRRAAA